MKADRLHKFNSLALPKFGKHKKKLTKTCFEHCCRTSKLYYTASSVITHIGGRPMHSPISIIVG